MSVTSWRGAGAGRLLVAITSDVPVRVNVAPKTVRAAAEANAVLDAAAALEPAVLASEHVGWWKDFWYTNTLPPFVIVQCGGSDFVCLVAAVPGRGDAVSL